jgi:protein TonB
MRAAVSVLPAMLVTMALFYLMQIMVSGSGERFSQVDDYGIVDFVRLQRDLDPPPDPLHPQRPLRQRPSSPAGPPSTPELAQAEAQAPVSPPPLKAEMPALGPVELSGRPFLGPLLSVAKKPVAPAKPPAIRDKPSGRLPAPAIENPLGKAAMARLTSIGKGPAEGRPGGISKAEPGVSGELNAQEGDVIPLFKLKPRYPRRAARSGKEGWVKVAFTITERGTVTDAKVVESRPRRIFDRSAIKAIRKWRFRPMVVDGKAMSRQATQLIEFKLTQK